MPMASLGMASIAVFPCDSGRALDRRVRGGSPFMQYVGSLFATCCDILHAQPQQKAQGPTTPTEGTRTHPAEKWALVKWQWQGWWLEHHHHHHHHIMRLFSLSSRLPWKTLTNFCHQSRFPVSACFENQAGEGGR